MFCIKCGRKASTGNFCDACFLEKKELFDLNTIKLSFCENCGHIFSNKIKVKDVEDFIINNIKTENKLVKKDANIKRFPDRIEITITAIGFIRPVRKIVTSRKKFVLYIKRMKCKNCVKILGNYHEAVLQIRGEKKEKILQMIGKLLQQENLASIDKIKEGYNVKIIRKSAASMVINILKRQFTVRRSFKLVGEKKGSKIYRNFYSVR